LDVNTPSDPSKKYYNTSGSWAQSQLPGMWMIRPVFSGQKLYTSTSPSPEYDESFMIYPNPADNQFQVHSTFSYSENSFLEILDISGRLVCKIDGVTDSVSASNLAEGVYAVRITDKATGTIQIARLVVQHP
ncbi:MAG: T9SS type A sorting domain-containing protein, partial [Bacteroidota bacterium]